jgi:hypothetical protein
MYKINLTRGYTARPVHLYLRDNILDTGEIYPSRFNPKPIKSCRLFGG